MKLDNVDEPSSNYEVVAGTGERCVPASQDRSVSTNWNILLIILNIFRCGDGGPATQARLAFPKGIAVSVDRSVYISDGKSIRIVHQNGKIDTLIGAHSPIKHLIPVSCETSYLVSPCVYKEVIKTNIKDLTMDHNWRSDIHSDISWFTLVLRSKSILYEHWKTLNKYSLPENSVGVWLMIVMMILSIL